MSGQKSLGEKVARTAGDITGITGVAKGAVQATRVAKGLVTGEEYSPSVTPKQFIGSAGKLGLTAATLGSAGLASGIRGGLGIAARAAESATLGAGFQAASNLEAQKPATEGIKTAAGIGGVVPPLLGAGGRFISAITKGLPSRIINSDIKPLLRDLSYGKNPGRAVAREQIVADNLDDLSQKISAKVTARGEEIGVKYERASGEVSDYIDVMKPLDDALAKAEKNPRTNSVVIERIKNLKKDILGVQEIKDEAGQVTGEQVTRNLIGLNPKAAFEFKKNVGELTRFTGNRSDDEFVNRALKGVYRAIDSKLDKLVPGLERVNAHYSDLLSAKISTDYRQLVNERRNLISLVPKLGAGAALFYGIATGDTEGAATALLADLALATSGSTAAKTRIAALLTRVSPGARASVIRNFPIVQRLIGK